MICVRIRRRAQHLIFIRHETHHQRPPRVDDLRRPGARVGRRRREDGSTPEPRAAVIGAEDGAQAEETDGGGFVDEDEGFAVVAYAGDGGHAVAGRDARAGNADGGRPGSAAVAGDTLQGVLILGAVLVGVVDLQGAVDSVAEVGFPVAGHGTVVSGGLGEVTPSFTAVVRVGNCNAEVGVGSGGGFFAVVAEGAEDAS